MTENEQIKSTEPIKKETAIEETKPVEQKKKKKLMRPLFWGLAISLIVIIIAVVAVAGVRFYKFKATDAFTTKTADWLLFPAAMVDRQLISYHDVRSLTDTLMHYLQYESDQNPGNELYAVPAYQDVLKDTLEQRIQDAFIEKKATERNIQVTSAEAQAEVDKLSAQAQSYGEDLESALRTRYNWNIDQFKEVAIVPQIWQNKLGLSVAQDESIEDNKKAKEQINSIYADITAGTITFEDAAKQYSNDTSTAASGGDLGLSSPDVYVEEFKNALVALSVDQVSQPIMTTYGWHIIKLLEKVDQADGTVQYRAEHILLSTVDFNTWLSEEMAKVKIRRFI